jgi:hypothetical protein
MSTGMAAVRVEVREPDALPDACPRHAVLDWNEPSIRFYRSIGAVSLDGWTVRRLSGSASAPAKSYITI